MEGADVSSWVASSNTLDCCMDTTWLGRVDFIRRKVPLTASKIVHPTAAKRKRFFFVEALSLNK